MRPRSRGVSCQSFNELIDVVESMECVQKNEVLLNQSSFTTIQEYLQSQQQQSLSQQTVSQYYLFQADQLRAEEEEQLTKKPSPDITKIEIAIICPSLPLIYQQLQAEKQLSQPTLQRYYTQPQPHPSIVSQTLGEKHLLPSEPAVVQQCVPFLAQKDSYSSAPEPKDKKNPKEQLISESIGKDSRPLDLVVYYNNHSLKKQHNQEDKSPEKQTVFQYKIWLIQQAYDYSHLLKCYLDRCQHIFECLSEEGEMMVRCKSEKMFFKEQSGHLWDLLREIQTDKIKLIGCEQPS